jgi:hypothetical protein
MDRVYRADQVPTPLLREALHDERLRWAFAERMEDTVLTYCAELLDGTVDLGRWSHGRAFGPGLELAWWKRDVEMEARAIVAGGGEPPPGIDWDLLSPAGWQRADAEATLLWGELDPDVPAGEPSWSTAQIPRYLGHPIADGAPRVVLVRQAYRQGGIVIASRLVEVKGWDDV